MYWIKPLTQEQIQNLIKANRANGPCKITNGPIGPMVVHDVIVGLYRGRTYCCGGDTNAWTSYGNFIKNYPDWNKPSSLLDPEFNLEDIESAEIIMQELK